MRKIRTISDFICTRSVLYLRVHRTKSVLYPRVHRTISPRTSRVHRAYIGLNPYYIAAYIRTISDFLAFLKPLSNCNTNALCLNHVQIWSLICIRGCASPMPVVDESTLQVTPSHVKLSEQDIQGICDELLTYLQAQAPIDTRIAAILNDQQSEGELLKTVTKKSRNGTRSRAAEAAGDCSMRARRNCAGYHCYNHCALRCNNTSVE